MPVIGKVWGTTECLRKTPFIEIHRLKIKPRYQCSLHVHRHKRNDFFVVRGSLTIEVTKNDYPLTDVTRLVAGQDTTVKPGEFHLFKTGDQGCECLEIYYPEEMSEDIERRGHGGAVESARAGRK